MRKQPEIVGAVPSYLQLVRAAVRAWPLPRGKGWLVNRATARFKAWPDNVLLKFSGGSAIHADLRDPMFRSLFFFGEYEREVTAVIDSILRPGDTVVDAGANFGHFSLIASRKAGPTGHVHAFEPMPQMADRLRRNLHTNGADNVTVNVAALGEQPGTATIHVPPPGVPSGHASLGEVGFQAAQKVECPVVPLDDYLCKAGIEHVDLLKVDVEGSELRLLKGARQMLSSANPPMITLECNYETAQAFGYDPPQMLDFLRGVNNGYVFYEIVSGGLEPLGAAKPAHGANLLCCIPALHGERTVIWTAPVAT
jgi:FkbM family methyltransferase